MRATITRYVLPDRIEVAPMKLPKAISQYVLETAVTGKDTYFGRYSRMGGEMTKPMREIESAVLGRGGMLGWYNGKHWLDGRYYVNDTYLFDGDVSGVRVDPAGECSVAFFAWIHPLFEDFLMDNGYVEFSSPHIGNRGNIWPFTFYGVLKPFGRSDFDRFCSEMARKRQKQA